MYDVVIIGGGPAGTTLARLIAHHKNVLILDRRDLANPFQGGYEKTCGGLLAPDAQEMLARLGLGLPKEILVGPQLFTVRTMDLESGRERYYPRNYLNVDREAFDRWLVSMLPPQVEVRWGSLFRAITSYPQGYSVSYSQGGQLQQVQARFVVGADGANSRLRAELEATSPRRYVAMQEWFRVNAAQPYYSAIFDGAVTDFYSWTIPKEDKLLVGSAIPAGTDVHRRFALLKERLALRGYDLNNSVKLRGTHLLRPSSLGQVYLGRDCLALIGEAAGWVSPSSAEGLSYAFRSASALARALEPSCTGALRRYHSLCRGLRLNILGKLAKSPAMYWPILRRMAMGSGLFSIHMLE